MDKHYSQLTLKERKEIEAGLDRGDPFRGIASLIGRQPSTVSREVRENRHLRAYKARRSACRGRTAAYDPAAAKDTTGIAGSADGQFYTAAANWAVASKVITGIVREDGSLDFAAEEDVTFEQLVTILARVGATPDEVAAAGSDLSSFLDGSGASAWSAPSLKWAADEGLIEGYDTEAGKLLAPGEDVARERVATVLMRAFELGILK